MKIPSVKVVFSKEDRKQILQRLDNSLVIGYVAMGKNVQEFEEKFSIYMRCKHAIAVNSGSSAIEIAMRILNVNDKEVLVPTNTFLATAAGVFFAGGRVRLVDVDPETFSVTLEELKRRVTNNTVGVVLVHVGGIITSDIENIKAWCDTKGLWLIEDSAHSHGSEWNGKRAGSFGLAGTYSFFATKVMTCGEGGMIVTENDDFANKVRLMRNHGKPEPWVSYHTYLGSNWRMSEMNAILGLIQLKRLDEFITWREKIAKQYTEMLDDISGVTLVLPQSRSSWYKYIVLLDPDIKRDKLKTEMKQRGVSLAGEVYGIPLHDQPIFKGITKGDFPKANDVCRRHICLPLYYGMTEKEAAFVVKALIHCIAKQ